MSIALFVGTRKGAFVLRSNDRSKWELVGPSYLGHTANHVVLDPRTILPGQEEMVARGIRAALDE